MEVFNNIAFIGFMIVAIALAMNGIVYLFAGKVMTYHTTAMGKAWEALSKGMQVMSLSFMKSAAAGMLSTSVALVFLLCIPFRRGEVWSIFALFLVSIIEMGVVTSRVFVVRKYTQGKPPLGLSLVLIGIISISFICALIAKMGL